MQKMSGRYYTIGELSILFDVSIMTINRWIKVGGEWYKPELKVTRIGDLVRFRDVDVIRFAKKLKKEIVLDK